MFSKKYLKYIFLLLILFSLEGSLNSCRMLHLDQASRMNKKALHQKDRAQRKSDNKFTKEYDKKYKRQTKIQKEPQRNMIKQARKKPKNMGKSKSRFFLFRWLGL